MLTRTILSFRFLHVFLSLADVYSLFSDCSHCRYPETFFRVIITQHSSTHAKNVTASDADGYED